MKATFCAVLVLGLLASVVMAEDMVDNPAYKMWSGCKAGTTVKTQMTSVMTMGEQEMTTKTTMTTTLKELTAEKAMTETVTETEVGGQKMAMPAMKLEIMAKVAKSTTQPATAAGSKTTKKGEGDEEITVAGKKYKAHWVESATVSDQTESTSKIWTTDQIPGGMAKSVTDMTKPMKSKTTMEVIEIVAGK